MSSQFDLSVKSAAKMAHGAAMGILIGGILIGVAFTLVVIGFAFWVFQ